MVDIISTPARNDTAGTQVLIGGILLAILALLFIFRGLPTTRVDTQNTGIEAQAQQIPNTEVVETNVMQPQE